MIMIFSARLRRDCLLSLGFKCPRLSLPWVNGKTKRHQNFRLLFFSVSLSEFISVFPQVESKQTPWVFRWTPAVVGRGFKPFLLPPKVQSLARPCTRTCCRARSCRFNALTLLGGSKTSQYRIKPFDSNMYQSCSKIRYWKQSATNFSAIYCWWTADGRLYAVKFPGNARNISLVDWNFWHHLAAGLETVGEPNLAFDHAF